MEPLEHAPAPEIRREINHAAFAVIENELYAVVASIQSRYYVMQHDDTEKPTWASSVS
jgi:hypothetical protein